MLAGAPDAVNGNGWTFTNTVNRNEIGPILRGMAESYNPADHGGASLQKYLEDRNIPTSFSHVANPDWAPGGYDARALDRGNRTETEFLGALGESSPDIHGVRIVGCLGPRGDGCVAGERVGPDEAADCHRARSRPSPTPGSTWSRPTRSPVARWGSGSRAPRAGPRSGSWIGFTVEIGGRLPNGAPLRDVIARVESEESAHGSSRTALTPLTSKRGWMRELAEPYRPGHPQRLDMSHAELEEAKERDPGDIGLRPPNHALSGRLHIWRSPRRCCGTDARQVSAGWGI